MPNTLFVRKSKTGRSSLCCCLALVLATGLRLTCFGGCTGSWQISTDESHGDRYVKEGYIPAFEAVPGFYHPAENYDEFHTYSINVPQGMKARVRITYERAVSNYSGGRMVVEDVKNEGEASYDRGQTYSVLLSSSRTINVRTRAYRDEDGKGLCTCWYRISVEFKEDAPDLCVKSVATDPSKCTPVDQPAVLKFDVQNTGFRSSSASKARVYDGNAQLEQIDIQGLATDARASRTLTLPSLAVGDHLLRVAIDSVPGENVPDNNEMTVGLKVFNRTPYHVEFNANGGGGKMDPQDFVCGTPKALDRNAFIPPRGYEFDGWARDPNGSADWKDGERVENLTFDDGGTVTFYAVWKTIPSFSVRFNANGGVGEMPVQQIFRDETVKLAKCAFERPGYRFIGWKRRYDGSSSNQAIDVIDEAELRVSKGRAGWLVRRNISGCGMTLWGSHRVFLLGNKSELCRGECSYMHLDAVWGREAERIEGTRMSKGLDLVVSETDAWEECCYYGTTPLADSAGSSSGFHSAYDLKPGWLSIVVEGPVVLRFSLGTSCTIDSSMLVLLDGRPEAEIYGRGGDTPKNGIFWEGRYTCEVYEGRHVITYQIAKSNETGLRDWFDHCFWAGNITVSDARLVLYHANSPGADNESFRQLVEAGERTVKIETQTFSKPDKVLCGWSKRPESREVAYRAGDVLELEDTEKDVDLYAVWKTPGEIVGAPELDLQKNDMASWYLNDNPEDGGETLLSSAMSKNGERYFLDLEGDGVFSFWWKWIGSDSKSGRIVFSVDDKEKAAITEDDGVWKNVRLELGAGEHALGWTAAGDGWLRILLGGFAWIPGGACYTVRFFSGTAGSGMMLDKLLACGKVYPLPPCTFTPPVGKRFVGWACSNGRRYDDGMLVFDLAKPGETVTMTAIWE